MLKKHVSVVSRCLLFVMAIQMAFPVAAAPPIIEKLLAPLKRHGHAPKTSQDACIEELAANIDWLEHNIDRYGSIVAKEPDVWGEARLTKYRGEVEAELAKQVGNFRATLNGASAVRDLALLAASLQMASGEGADTSDLGDFTQISIGAEGIEPQAPKLGDFGLMSSNGLFFASELELEPVTVLDQQRRYLDHLNELRRINEGDDAADAPGYSLNLVRIPVSVLPGSKTTHGYGAEITATATMELPEHLLADTFRDLVINDLVDQLGLPMTRFLNSDPARVAQLLAAFAADQQPTKAIAEFIRLVEDNPIVTSDPLIAAAIEKRLTQVGKKPNYIGVSKGDVRLLKFVNYDFTLLQQDVRTFDQHIAPLLEAIDRISMIALRAENAALLATTGVEPPTQTETDRQNLELAIATLDGYDLRFEAATNEILAKAGAFPPGVAPTVKEMRTSSNNKLAPAPPSFITPELARRSNGPDRTSLLEGMAGLAVTLTDDLRKAAATTTIPSSLSRRSTLPYPPSELVEILGDVPLGWLVLKAHDAFRVDAVNRSVVHLVDIQAFLREELVSAYALLSRPEYTHLWQQEAAEPTLASQIRLHQHDQIRYQRQVFLDGLPVEVRNEPVAVLAWAVFVESVLLNERLNQAVAEVLGPSHCTPGVLTPFFGPMPPAEAAETFNEYVAARWPLRVFTIDPVTTEQNIADTAAIARQMQFAAAFAVASGEMGANAGLNFARNIQQDFATVGLNQTAVGFMHGDNTFGWRFQPRFQTPPVQNNAVVIVRDLIGGGPTDNAKRRQRRIEPGVRECVALVLTPSFVTGITIDTRTNWYRLNKPGHSAISMQELTKQSRAITAMRRAADCCVRRADLYRTGEVSRMLRRVDQLDKELPLQTLHCQVPNSTTLGGFEILSSGARELAPELLGWYGSPGYTPGVDGQTFFLAGDNFSVHETEIIVGTKMPTRKKLISRQIIEVTLPGDILIIRDGRLGGLDFGDPDAANEYSGYIDAHLASPYGVSGHLLIPVLKTPTAKPDAKPTLKVLPPPTTTSGAATSAAGATTGAAAASPVINIRMRQSSGIYSVTGSMRPAYLPIAEIEIPQTVANANAGLADGKVDVVITPTVNGQPFEAAVLKDISAPDGKLTLTSPQLLESLESKGDLHDSMSTYANWAINTQLASAVAAAVSQGTPLEAQINWNIAVREDDDAPAQAVGKMPVKLQFSF